MIPKSVKRFSEKITLKQSNFEIWANAPRGRGVAGFGVTHPRRGDQTCTSVQFRAGERASYVDSEDLPRFRPDRDFTLDDEGTRT